LWHKTCLIKYLVEHPEEQNDYRTIAPA
jgi:hypothetical protein